MRPLFVLLACLLLALTACDDTETTQIRGSGNVVTETRAVIDFDEISVAGFGEVIVAVGPEASLIVEAEDNVLPYLVTEVVGDTLEISSEDDISFRDVEEPIYTVTVPSLDTVTIAGSGAVTASGVGGESFKVTISGSGDVTPEGSVTSVDVTIAGSGTFLGAGLVSSEGTVSISGSGTVVVHATGTLEASIAGSGNITYLGDPELTQSIAGSGSIVKG